MFGVVAMSFNNICEQNLNLSNVKEKYFGDIETSLSISGQRYLVELAFIDEHENIVFHSYVNNNLRFENIPDNSFLARKGITDDLLLSAPPINVVLERLKAVTKGKDLILYNAKKDLPFIKEGIISAKKIICAMEILAPFCGRYVPKFGDHCWANLWEAHNYLNLECPPGLKHRALTDAIALRRIYHWAELIKLKIENEMKGYQPEQISNQNIVPAF